MNDLIDMLTYKRPAGSRSEKAFIRKYLMSLPGAKHDRHGNIHVQVGNGDGMFSAHTDTVHRTSGRQKVRTLLGFATLDTKEMECLGADDAAGVYILRRMILAGVPGRYIFHRGEEIGGIGSRAYAHELSGGEYSFAVAFDRRGYADVITHQGFERCCSDEFGEALSIALGGKYAPCDRGVFTDTANYTDVIGECTNVSVGYFNEHGKHERLDLDHVMSLADRVCTLDWYNLPLVREPGEIDGEFWYETTCDFCGAAHDGQGKLCAECSEYVLNFKLKGVN